MNIFSNIGITELVVILLLALLVVGPERLPEMAQKLAKLMRDFRKFYENMTKEFGPELRNIQRSTQEIRDSVDSVRSIPKDMVNSVVDAAELNETIAELKGVTDSLEEVRRTASGAAKVVKNPVGAAVDVGRNALSPAKPDAPVAVDEEVPEQAGGAVAQEADGAPEGQAGG